MFQAAMLRQIFASLLSVVLLSIPSIGCNPAEASAGLTCEEIPRLLGTYLRHHIRFRTLSDELRDRTLDLYVKRLDPSKTLLLEREAAEIRASLEDTFDQIRAGNCHTLMDAEARVLERMRETERWVRGYADRRDYAVDSTVELALDPEQRGYPKQEQERADLLRKFVHFQMSNYLISGTQLEEAKDKLVHRYELSVKRMQEREPEDVYARFLEAFANSLDPHSGYLSADLHEDFQIAMSLSLEGIGVALASRDGYSVVEEIITGGATDRANALKPKDKIISVAQADGEPVDIIDMDLRDVVRLIRGKKGTPVRLGVLRQDEGLKRFTVTIIRDKIDLERQAAKLHFEELPLGDETLKLAVLELPSFYGDSNPARRRSSRDVRKLLGQAEAQAADGLLVDLSRNGGGILQEAIRLSGFFIHSGGIVAVQNSDGRAQVHRDPDEGILFRGPVVVLTSRVSASASEILAGALKDYRRAVIVGDDHTFGKGTVQSVAPLQPHLGALRYTTQLFFRPGGKSTQREGVAADVVIPSLTNRDDIGEASQPYALSGSEITPFVGTRANLGAPEQRWRPISDEMIVELAGRSQGRVAQSAEFEEIRQRLASIESDNGVVRVADILKGRNGEAGGDGPAPDADGDAEGEERDDSPQVREALHVLADLVALNR